MSTENWIHTEESPSYRRQQALQLLAKVKRRLYGRGKKYRLVKICNAPLTYKEVEIKDEELDSGKNNKNT